MFVGTFVPFSGIAEGLYVGTADRGNLLDDFEHSTDSAGRAYSLTGWSGSVRSVKTEVSL